MLKLLLNSAHEANVDAMQCVMGRNGLTNRGRVAVCNRGGAVGAAGWGGGVGGPGVGWDGVGLTLGWLDPLPLLCCDKVECTAGLACGHLVVE